MSTVILVLVSFSTTRSLSLSLTPTTMPPKVPPRRLQQDWSWVGDEAKSVDEITAGHRRRAAGLGPELSRAARRGCAFKYEQRGSRSQTVDSNVTDDSVVIVNDPCNAKKCKNSPRCYNHLGDKNVSAAAITTSSFSLLITHYAPVV